MEIWKDVYFIDNGIEYDYRGLYQVSNKGNVKSLNYNHTTGKEKILKPIKIKNGYLQVGLCKNGKQKWFYVHRLVAFMFIENCNPEYKTEVNHIDEDKENNSVDNLEWCTRKYNCNYGNRNKKMSEAMKGENHPMYGIHRYGKDNPNLGSLVERWSKDGKLIDIKYQFEYVEMGFNQGHIYSCCKGKRKSTGGYIFKYHIKKEEE